MQRRKMSEKATAHFSVARADVSDSEAIADAYLQAFGFPADRSAAYLDQIGIENFRLLRVDNRLAAAMAVIETGHWLGGKAVRAINIAHVAINPEWRGGGLAGRFLESICADAAARGAGMATLFASTRPVYRRAGFSLAGLETIYEAETSALPRARDTGFVRLQGDAILAAIEPLYSQHCAGDSGGLQRAPAHWRVLLAGNPTVYLSATRDAPGYLVIDTSDQHCLVVRDWVAFNGRAASHLLTLLGTFSSVYPRVQWHGSPQDALVFALPDKGWRLVHQEEWLARVLDPVAALEQRGYASDGVLGIDLVSPEAETRLMLNVRDGVASCAPREAELPTIRMALADLGTLLTGHRSARFLARAGILTGDAAAVRLCDTLFAGPAPWVGEHF